MSQMISQFNILGSWLATTSTFKRALNCGFSTSQRCCLVRVQRVNLVPSDLTLSHWKWPSFIKADADGSREWRATASDALCSFAAISDWSDASVSIRSLLPQPRSANCPLGAHRSVGVAQPNAVLPAVEVACPIHEAAQGAIGDLQETTGGTPRWSLKKTGQVVWLKNLGPTARSKYQLHGLHQFWTWGGEMPSFSIGSSFRLGSTLGSTVMVNKLCKSSSWTLGG